ncbi:DUF2845 domain-containing protein [Halioxenophilus aromaticivorans]|uniref:DUF2845 domain-containing protein n=1 Tax=Halioxenophilus aromaticivorans TaxID=1306992 RepID=A0AAV3U7H1_9ALTE
MRDYPFGLKPLSQAFFLLFLTVFATHAGAKSLRCDQKLVAVGDSTHRVLSHCGEPNDLRKRTETRVVRNAVQSACGVEQMQTCTRIVERYVNVEIQEWIYDLGPRRLLRNLTFENGSLVKVESDGFGSN